MITVTVITKNEESNIARCLNSVLWADEIIVVDAQSDDRTREIAAKIGAKVIVREWEGFARQKEFALHQSSFEWVLSLDADEEVTPELKNEIEKTVRTAAPLDGYEIPRKSFFLGKWIRHGGWYPGYQLRLFKKSKTRMIHRPVHEGFIVDGSVGKLSSDLNHYTYSSLHQYIDKLNDYSSLDVRTKISKQRTVRWYNFLLNPFSSFMRMYFSLGGYKDGFHGFLLAWYSSLHVLVIYAKSWEYQNAVARSLPLPPITSEDLAERKKMTS